MNIIFLIKEDTIHTDADITACTGVHTLASLWQIHGSRTIVVREPTRRTEQADGFVTDTPGLLLTIRTADCQPILVYAPQHNVVGLLHVGWRGLIPSPLDHTPPPPTPPPCGGEGSPPSPGRRGRGPAARGPDRPSGPERGGGGQQTAIQSFFTVLQQEWNIHPQDTLVGIGPSLRQCCAEYHEPDHPLRQFPARFWKGNNIDLTGIADMQLTELGVPHNHIERLPDCTCCHPETYWTYRGGDRDKVSQGYTNVLVAQLR